MENAGITVCVLKGTISKDIVETRSCGKKLFFLLPNSLNFLVAPCTCKSGCFVEFIKHSACSLEMHIVKFMSVHTRCVDSIYCINQGDSFKCYSPTYT